MATIGEKLRYLRFMKGKTQEQIRNELGFGSREYQRCENDQQITKNGFLITISKYYKVPVSYLLDDSIGLISIDVLNTIYNMDMFIMTAEENIVEVTVPRRKRRQKK